MPGELRGWLQSQAWAVLGADGDWLPPTTLLRGGVGKGWKRRRALLRVSNQKRLPGLRNPPGCRQLGAGGVWVGEAHPCSLCLPLLACQDSSRVVPAAYTERRVLLEKNFYEGFVESF